jgi:hypothetical protein
MEKRVIRVYFSGYVEKEVPAGTKWEEIYDIKEELCASLTAEDIGKCMTEDDYHVFPDYNETILR